MLARKRAECPKLMERWPRFTRKSSCLPRSMSKYAMPSLRSVSVTLPPESRRESRVNSMVVFGVRPDPGPYYDLALPPTYRTVVSADAGGKDWEGIVNPTKPEARVLRVRLKQAIGAPSLLLDGLGEPRKSFPEIRVSPGDHNSSGDNSRVRPAR